MQKFVFGKGRTAGKRREYLEKGFVDRGELELRWNSGVRKKRVVERYKYLGEDNKIWASEDASIGTVEKQLKFPIRKIIRKRFAFGSPVVVDWGCAVGSAITELATEFPHIRAYVFSKNSYKEWFDNDRVKFVLNDGKNFRRHFKKDSVDLLYSSKGIFHLDSKGYDYAVSILPVLKKGGVLVTSIDYIVSGLGAGIIEVEGMKFRVKIKNWTYPYGQNRVLHHKVLVAQRIA